jgi:hypothetical protein
LSECLDNGARGPYLDRRPQNRQIEPGVAVLGKPLTAMRNGADQTKRVKHTISQRRVGMALRSLVRLVPKAAGTQQALKEW